MLGKSNVDHDEAMNKILKDFIEDIVQTNSPEVRCSVTKKNFRYVKRQYQLHRTKLKIIYGHFKLKLIRIILYVDSQPQDSK